MSEDGVAQWQTLCVLDARGLDLVGWAAEVSERDTGLAGVAQLIHSCFCDSRAHGLAPRQSRAPSSKKWNSRSAGSGQITTRRARCR